MPPGPQAIAIQSAEAQYSGSEIPGSPSVSVAWKRSSPTSRYSDRPISPSPFRSTSSNGFWWGLARPGRWNPALGLEDGPAVVLVHLLEQPAERGRSLLIVDDPITVAIDRGEPLGHRSIFARGLSAPHGLLGCGLAGHQQSADNECGHRGFHPY